MILCPSVYNFVFFVLFCTFIFYTEKNVCVLIEILKHITPGRLLNLVKIYLSYYISMILRRPVVWGLPATFSIEPTNFCNLRCPECPSGTGQLTRAKGYLSLEDFSRIVDEIKGHAFYIQLFFQGEPYLNKDLGKMISYARQKNIFVSVSTNGLIITKNNSARIMEYPPDHLIFSMDGMDEETYRTYRVGGSYSGAMTALNEILTMKKSRSSKYPLVELQFLVMKQNESQIPLLRQTAKKLNVDRLALKSMQVYSYEDALKFLPSDEKYRRYRLDHNHLEPKGKLGNRCFALWRTAVISWDGNTAACCFDKDATFNFGNVKDMSIRDIWRSGKYNKFRREILLNRSAIPLCTNCTEGM